MSDLDALTRVVAEIRKRVISTSARAGIPHLASCLSCVEILVLVYWHLLDISEEARKREDRDRFILSKGHAAPALFQVLAMRGYFPQSWLDHYGEDGSPLGEHPPAHGVPGVEAATGSLGHGLPIALGMALAARIKGLRSRYVVLLSDGECNEGSVWEAAMMAAAHGLGQLAVIVDYNKWQATGRSNEVLALAPLADKWAAFGWDAREVNGHDLNALAEVLAAPRESGKPLAVIAHTVKGKGVSFMEDDNNWHYRIPKPDEVLRALAELGLEP